MNCAWGGFAVLLPDFICLICMTGPSLCGFICWPRQQFCSSGWSPNILSHFVSLLCLWDGYVFYIRASNQTELLHCYHCPDAGDSCGPAWGSLYHGILAIKVKDEEPWDTVLGAGDHSLGWGEGAVPQFSQFFSLWPLLLPASLFCSPVIKTP